MIENEIEDLPQPSHPVNQQNNSNNDTLINNSLPPVSNNILPNIQPQRINVNPNNKNENPNEKKNEEEEEFKQVEFMKPNSSYCFQIFLVIHSIYTFIYFILELIIFIGIKSFDPFLYGIGAYGVDIAILLFYFFHQIIRFKNANFGNRTEHSSTVIMSMAIFPIIFYIYFWFAQSYVLNIEVILNSFGVVLGTIELIFLILAFLAISKQENTM